jgi:broad specificity phosphatase PhoE
MSKKPEKIVYFVRHGQSEGNITPVFQTLDSPLSEKGREQAKLIAGRVSKLSFETLISSPLPRTKDTAEAISAATGKDIEYSELFVERVKPTALGGKSYDDPEADKLWQAWEESLYTPGVRAEDGENFDDLIERADKALKFLNERSEQTLVVVTHGFFLRTIVARVLLGDTLTPESFRKLQSSMEMENTGITVLRDGERYEGTSWMVWIYNDHAHLG